MRVNCAGWYINPKKCQSITNFITILMLRFCTLLSFSFLSTSKTILFWHIYLLSNHFLSMSIQLKINTSVVEIRLVNWFPSTIFLLYIELLASDLTEQPKLHFREGFLKAILCSVVKMGCLNTQFNPPLAFVDLFWYLTRAVACDCFYFCLTSFELKTKIFALPMIFPFVHFCATYLCRLLR